MDDSKKGRPKFHRSFSTIQTFEGDDDATNEGLSGISVGTESHGNNELIAINQQLPANLLLVALLDHLSSLYISDPNDSRQLFRVLVNQLVQHNFLPKLSSLDEISSLRSQYKSSFSRLVQAAVTSISQQGLNIPKPSNIHERIQIFIQPRILRHPLLTLRDEICLQSSRYHEEFDQTGTIDSGAYGSVFKAENKLDGCEYAIKKIPFEGSEPEVWLKIMREVKLLAQLSHKNVVRYHNSWIEYTPLHRLHSGPIHSSHTAAKVGGVQNLPAITYATSSGDSISEKSIESNEKGKEPDDEGDANGYVEEEEEDDGIIFSETADSAVRPSNLPVQLVQPGIKPSSTHNIGPFIEDLPTSSPSPEISPSRFDFTSAQNGRQAVVLHIQMELCESNLKDWLQERNGRLSNEQYECEYDVVDEVENLHLLKHILKAVDFIHRNGLIHRDIKPTNIFLSPGNTPKLGDFGLARYCCDQPYTPNPGMPPGAENSHYTTGIGTTLYAAPEQLSETVYNEKCDMYSVGIVMFEMYQPFGTVMQRVKYLDQLRQKGTLPSEFQKRWPKLAEYISKLLSETPEHRPSAGEIIHSELFLTKDQIISQLRKENKDQLSLIAELQEQLTLKTRENESLRLELDYKSRRT